MSRPVVPATTEDGDTHPWVAEIERLRAFLDDATTQIENLTIALQTSRDIGSAMGILMVTYTISRDQAFALLRMASQGLRRKLADIAVEVIETGALPDPPKRRPKSPKLRSATQLGP